MADEPRPAEHADAAHTGPANAARDRADPALLAGRLDEYRQLWEQTARRLVHEEYHAEDLIDDWFTLWGKVVRDTTAMAAMSWRAGNEQAKRQASPAGAAGTGGEDAG